MCMCVCVFVCLAVLCVPMCEKDGKSEGGEKTVPFTNVVKPCSNQWYSYNKRDGILKIFRNNLQN